MMHQDYLRDEKEASDGCARAFVVLAGYGLKAAGLVGIIYWILTT